MVTDDFPKDHPHHRGISWMWPVVVVDGKTYDLWTIKGILDRFEKWERKKAGKDKAVLAFQDGWYIGDRKVVQENVEIVAHSLVDGRRDLDITVTLHSGGTRRWRSAARTNTTRVMVERWKSASLRAPETRIRTAAAGRRA